MSFLTSDEGKAALKDLGGLSSARTGPQAPGPGSDGLVSDLMESPVAQDLARTAAREIVREVFGIGRRRR